MSVSECKDTGNALFKKGKHDEAIAWYSRGLDLDTGPCEDRAVLGPCEDRAVLFSNRAAAHLATCNFRSALEDSESALALTESDVLKIKVQYRASKAALGIGGTRLAEALKYCRAAQAIKKSKDLSELEKEIQSALQKQLKLQDDREEKRDDRKEMAKLFSEALSRRGWRLGSKLMYSTPYNDSKAIGAGYHDAKDLISFPVIFMYPEYRTSDLCEGMLESDTFWNFAEKLFPRNSPPLPWDSNRVFLWESLSDLSWFVKTNDFQQNTFVQKWAPVDARKSLSHMISETRDYVIPKWPVIFIVSKLYREKFLSLRVDEIN